MHRTFAPDQPLGVALVEMGQSAANDPRFLDDPITPQELASLKVEVSILSELTPTREPASLQVGVHGIYVIRGSRAGCFLPEVATDQGWNAEQFLSYCCSHKAGLAADAWKDPRTQVLLFTSEKISE